MARQFWDGFPHRRAWGGCAGHFFRYGTPIGEIIVTDCWIVVPAFGSVVIGHEPGRAARQRGGGDGCGSRESPVIGTPPPSAFLIPMRSMMNGATALGLADQTFAGIAIPKFPWPSWVRSHGGGQSASRVVRGVRCWRRKWRPRPSLCWLQWPVAVAPIVVVVVGSGSGRLCVGRHGERE